MKIKVFLLLIFIFYSFQSCKTENKKTSKSENIKKNDSLIKELSASDIYQSSKNAIAIIIAYDENGIPQSQGTGFFINNKNLITNYHVIENSKSIRVKLIDSNRFLKKSKVKLSNEKYDLAIIETEFVNNYLTLDSISSPIIGSKIYTIGNPRGLTGTISEGIISAKRKNEYDLIQITAPISPGNSGGPLINNKGKVIGVSTFTYKNSQNLNFAIPIKYISYCKKHIYKKYKKKKIKKLKNKSAVTVSKFKKDGSEYNEHISLKNNTSHFIKSITGVIIYKDMKNNIIDYKLLDLNILIPPHLAKRYTYKSFDQAQSYAYYKDNRYGFDDSFKIEFRLLSYEIEE